MRKKTGAKRASSPPVRLKLHSKKNEEHTAKSRTGWNVLFHRPRNQTGHSKNSNRGPEENAHVRMKEHLQQIPFAPLDLITCRDHSAILGNIYRNEQHEERRCPQYNFHQRNGRLSCKERASWSCADEKRNQKRWDQYNVVVA